MEAGISLRPPRSVVPKLLALTDKEETNTAFEAIRDWMDRRYWPMEGRASALQERLKKVIEQCLRTMTIPYSAIGVPSPPGWEIFRNQWLHRAINFLVHRACDEPGSHQEGVHWHGDDAHIYYSAPPGTVMSLEEREQERDKQDMEVLFGEFMI